MTKAPSIDTLVDINKVINRRLHVFWDEKKQCYLGFRDSDGHKINAKPIGLSQVISAAQRPCIHFQDEEAYRRPFRVNLAAPFSYDAFLTHYEATIVLGKDYDFFSTNADINAMLEAATSGPNSSNAYVLGSEMRGIHDQPEYSIYSVQYYRIHKASHSRLGISPESLEFCISQVKEERARDEAKNNEEQKQPTAPKPTPPQQKALEDRNGQLRYELDEARRENGELRRNYSAALDRIKEITEEHMRAAKHVLTAYQTDKGGVEEALCKLASEKIPEKPKKIDYTVEWFKRLELD